VASNITYEALTERIDATIARFSNESISRGTLRLMYFDEDLDPCTIMSDDDIKLAFQEFVQTRRDNTFVAWLPGFEIYCVAVGLTL
jgi:cell division control protein 24